MIELLVLVKEAIVVHKKVSTTRRLCEGEHPRLALVKLADKSGNFVFSN